MKLEFWWRWAFFQGIPRSECHYIKNPSNNICMSKDRLATITNSPISVDTPVKVEVHITVQYGSGWKSLASDNHTGTWTSSSWVVPPSPRVSECSTRSSAPEQQIENHGLFFRARLWSDSRHLPHIPLVRIQWHEPSSLLGSICVWWAHSTSSVTGPMCLRPGKDIRRSVDGADDECGQ